MSSKKPFSGLTPDTGILCSDEANLVPSHESVGRKGADRAAHVTHNA